MKRVHDFSILNGDKSGHKHPESINTLQAMFKNKTKGTSYYPYYTFVSRFVMLRVMLRCKVEVFKSLNQISELERNPSFDGWVFEFDFLYSVRKAAVTPTASSICVQQFMKYNVLTAHTLKMTEKNHHWNVRSVVLSDQLLSVDDFDGLFIIPDRWNQGGWDAIYITRS